MRLWLLLNPQSFVISATIKEGSKFYKTRCILDMIDTWLFGKPSCGGLICRKGRAKGAGSPIIIIVTPEEYNLFLQ